MELNNIPKHVAVIMDGNGRWAKRRGLPRVRGHQVGAERVEEIIRAASDMGVRYLTLYAFSKENWERPKDEVSFLMQLLSGYLDRKLDEFKKNNSVFNVIGRIQDMPEDIQAKILRNMEETGNNTGITVTFAFSYSSRLEIADACRKIAEKVTKGHMSLSEINEQAVNDNLYTSGMPDPDLLIRTSGELRISNFLLWQISYSELYITEKCWPDFTRDEFAEAIRDYQKRERRFGRTHAANRQ